MNRFLFAIVLFGLAWVVTPQSLAFAEHYQATVIGPLGSGSYVRIHRAFGENWIGVGPRVVDGEANGEYAHLWNGTSTIDLNPAGYQFSYGWGASDGQQVGEGYAPGVGSHALLWHGSAESVVDLHPVGYSSSIASGVFGDVQVGEAVHAVSGQGHAMMWLGSAASAVDLNPAAFIWSYAIGASEDSQVGGASNLSTNGHAFLWHGSAESAVDLHPNGFGTSAARAVSGNSQVGAGWLSFDTRHALLWHGTAASAVDLHPAGYSSSDANGVSGGIQVGFASGEDSEGFKHHAYLWRGSAESGFNLHSLLDDYPVELVASEAFGIDGSGVIGGQARDAQGQVYAVAWMPRAVPEPSSLVALAATVVFVALHGRNSLRHVSH